MEEAKKINAGMIIAVDIGNSNVVVGVNAGEKWIHLWRIRTTTDKEAAYFYDVELRNKIFEHRLDINEVTGVIVSTVVPSLRDVFENLLHGIFSCDIVFVGPQLYEKLQFKVPRPYEIGTDLVANAYAAYKNYDHNSIVVDFGTALTFTTVSSEGSVLGVAIAPGILTAMKALSSQTAQLPEIPLQLPDSALGQNTTHAIQAGILWGYVGMTKELIAKIRAEKGIDYYAVATGGLSFIMKPLQGVFKEINPYLTLDGLKGMWEAIKTN